MKTMIHTEAQTNELRRTHRAAKNKKDADKIKAVYLLSRGKSPQEIAETIGNYRKRYEADGVSGLLKNNYFGSEPMLNCAEIEEFSDHLLTLRTNSCLVAKIH